MRISVLLSVSLLSVCRAWSFHGEVPITPPSATVLRYNISDAFCERIRRQFREDFLFSWSPVGCSDVTMMVRQGFDAWAHNSLVSFVQTTRGPVDITMSSSVDDTANNLGWAQQHSSSLVTIDISERYCWYTDRRFCDAVRDWYIPLIATLGLSWTISVLTILYVCWRPASTAFDAISRIVAWTIVLSHPLALFTMYPCLVCFDFQTVVTHEVGHALGLLHANDDAVSSYCGCQQNRTACEADPSLDNIMHSVFQHRPTPCLSRDDVDAVRTVWGGSCQDPVWCYYSYSLNGFYRLSISLVYSFTFAWGVVFVRNLIMRSRLRSRLRSRHTAHRTEPTERSSSRSLPPVPVPVGLPPPTPASPRLRIVRTSEGVTLNRV